MPSTNLKKYVAGDSLTIRRTLTVSQAVTKAWFTVKSATTLADGSAEMQKVITTSDSAGTGQIEDDGGTSGTCSLRFDITASESLTLGWLINYYFDVQVKFTDGSIATPEYVGRMKLRHSITDAVT